MANRKPLRSKRWASYDCLACSHSRFRIATEKVRLSKAIPAILPSPESGEDYFIIIRVMKSDENKTYVNAPVLPYNISNCQGYQIDLSPIIIQTGQAPLSQKEDRTIDNRGVHHDVVIAQAEAILVMRTATLQWVVSA